MLNFASLAIEQCRGKIKHFNYLKLIKSCIKNELTKLKASAPKNALSKPHFNRKPSTNQAANPKTITLTTNPNIPRVIKLRSPKAFKTGVVKALRIPKTIPATNALPKLSTSIPKGSLDIITKLTAVTKAAIKNGTIPVIFFLSLDIKDTILSLF